jgi:hypothetical protein
MNDSHKFENSNHNKVAELFQMNDLDHLFQYEILSTKHHSLEDGKFETKEMKQQFMDNDNDFHQPRM